MTISLQSNYNILMNKLKRLIPLVITSILLITNIYFYHDYHKLDQTNTMFSIAIIVSILSILLKWLPHKPKIDTTIKVITILLVPLLIEMAVELCNNNLLSDIELRYYPSDCDDILCTICKHENLVCDYHSDSMYFRNRKHVCKTV